ncbi:MAG: hypothetical protein LBI02_03625, partial [Opitutaceae bacterium]|nr:hypothetical protein [Opitutaceae bacterium]
PGKFPRPPNQGSPNRADSLIVQSGFSFIFKLWRQAKRHLRETHGTVAKKLPEMMFFASYPCNNYLLSSRSKPLTIN